MRRSLGRTMGERETFEYIQTSPLTQRFRAIIPSSVNLDSTQLDLQLRLRYPDPRAVTSGSFWSRSGWFSRRIVLPFARDFWFKLQGFPVAHDSIAGSDGKDSIPYAVCQEIGYCYGGEFQM